MCQSLLWQAWIVFRLDKHLGVSHSSQLYLGIFGEKKDFCFSQFLLHVLFFAPILIVRELWKIQIFKADQPQRLLWDRAVSSNSLKTLLQGEKIHLFSMALHYLASLKDPVKEMVASDSNSSCCSPDEESDCGSRIHDTNSSTDNTAVTW